MAIQTSYPITAPLYAILAAADGIGAHIGSKLQLFGTQEETLTDELCDMWYIWSQLSMRQPGPSSAVLSRPLTLALSQSTHPEESRLGFDLGIRLMTPQGAKYALIQSKVFDPFENSGNGRLRCYKKVHWDKLKGQLTKMRAYATEQRTNLVFLAVYLPASKLTWETETFRTYEIGTEPIPYRNADSILSDQYGVSLIPDTSLLDSSGNWIGTSPYVRFSSRTLTPAPTTLSRLLLDMMLCRAGDWSLREKYADDWEDKPRRHMADASFAFPVRRQIDIQFSRNSNVSWDRFQAELRKFDEHWRE